MTKSLRFLEALTAAATILGGMGQSLRWGMFQRRLSIIEDELRLQRFILLLLTGSNLALLVAELWG